MDITKLKVSNTIYKLKDSTARDEIDKLKNNTISITEQNLTNEQKQQVLENLGIIDTSSFQTVEQVKALIIDQVSELIANKDTDFDTLKEMSAWLTEHKASAAQMNLAIQEKVDKSDVTNVVESGNTNPVTSGAVKSELDTNYYNKQSVDGQIGSALANYGNPHVGSSGYFNIGDVKIAWSDVECSNGDYNISCTLPIEFQYFSVIICVPYYSASANSQVYATWGGYNTKVVNAHVNSVGVNTFKFLVIGA